MLKSLAMCGALLSPGIAGAADLAAAPLTPPTYDWTGVYLGAQIGGGWYGDKPGSDPGYVPVRTHGVLGGLYGGYNWQAPGTPLVLGLDADFTLNGVNGRGHSANGNSGTIDWKWTGAVRGRVGYALDRFLPYVAGGLGFGRFETAYAWPSGSKIEGEATVTGWTIGAGIDYAITDNLIARLDYRYTDFGKNKVNLNYLGSYYDSSEVESNMHDVRVGVSYKF